MHSLLTIVSSLLVVLGSVHGRLHSKSQTRARQVEASHAFNLRARAAASGAGHGHQPQNITFHNPKAEKYYVDGRSIPEVAWDVGPSWSGLMPISSKPNEERQVRICAFILLHRRQLVHICSYFSGSSPQDRRAVPMNSSSGQMVDRVAHLSRVFCKKTAWVSSLCTVTHTDTHVCCVANNLVMGPGKTDPE
jgi:hypothetical protein